MLRHYVKMRDTCMSTASNRELDLNSEQTALHDYHVSMLFLNQHNSSILFYRKQEVSTFL